MVEIVRIHENMVDTPSAEIVGAKAANIVRMAKLGVPVPPAFVLPIELCRPVVAGDEIADCELRDALEEGIGFLEEITDRKFGDGRNPLLVSVRSGAARSMPGMLETVLDVGCSHTALRGLIRVTGNPRFAWDCRRRFLESYSETVLNLGPDILRRVCDDMLRAERAETEQDLDCEALERLVADIERCLDERDLDVPEKPNRQLLDAARAVYLSWGSERASTYRRLSGLEDLEGTAVTVQAMVFGNRGLRSGSGVAFSRDPSTGERKPIIEMLVDAQGEDVVAGRFTPHDENAIELINPELAQKLREVLSKLEGEFTDVQDIEFTVEDGTLWLLQTRSAKRTPTAELKIAVDLVTEGVIGEAEALKRVARLSLDSIGTTHFEGEEAAVSCGIGAAAGVATGRAVFESGRTEQFMQSGEPVILVRPDISTSDIAGFVAASGILTAAGGRTAHAALVARQLGKACVVGCSALVIDTISRRARLGERLIAEGDWISIDGGTGDIFLGRRKIGTVRPERDLAQIATWRARIAAE